MVVSPAQELPPEERTKFDWREPGSDVTEEKALDSPLEGALAYLNDVLGRSPSH